MKFVRSFACLVAALCIAYPAMAQTQPSQQPATPKSPSASTATKDSTMQKKGMKGKQGQTRKQAFDELDANGDGTISRAEADANPGLVVIFVQTDTNGDGQISPTEFAVVPIILDDGSMVQ
jgi:hypothetical protein